MKIIEFKKLSKELIDEGITIELLNKVQRLGKMSPAMLQGYEPINLVKCSNGYWGLLSDGTYLKDANGLIKFDIKTCVVARARYWVNYLQIEIESEVKKEVEKIKDELRLIVKNIIDKFNEILCYAEKTEDKGFSVIILLKSINREIFEQRKESALKFLDEHPNLQDYVNDLNNDLINEKFDDLYIRLKTDGLPVIASFEHGSAIDMELMIKYFHKDNIDSTIDLMKEKSHIELIAKLNVEKRYI